MRLIDAEAVEKYPIRRNNYDKENGDIHFINGVESVLEYVNNLPTIEAKPVVHAHWKEWYPPKEFILTGEEKLYICSNCDAKYSDIENQRFCPYCGAQMDEEVSE